MSVYWIDKEEERRENLAAYFRSEYQRAPSHWFSAPGRTEILGAYSHFDHGKTLSCALSCDVLCVAEARRDGMAEIRSEGALPVRFSVHDLESREREKGKPVALFRGVLGYLKKHGYSFGGFSACIQSGVLEPAGSCAAFESLIAEIVNVLYLDGKLSAGEKASAGQYAENVYFGKPGGLAEQAASIAGGFSLLDTSRGTPHFKRLPAPEGYCVVLIRAGEDDRAAFFQRAGKQLGEAAAYYGKRRIEEVSFREMCSDLTLLRRKVSDGAILRAFDYFEENERAERAAEALLRGDKDGFLREIAESGKSALCDLQEGTGKAESPVAVAMKLSEYLIKDGACNLLRGTGTVVSVVREEEAQGYFRSMARLFGRESVILSTVREEGACEIKV